jgi:hypothetical protein
LNYKYRMHDPRIGRFFAVDPLSGSYPYNSPYAFSENRVIDMIELEGLETVKFTVNGKSPKVVNFNGLNSTETRKKLLENEDSHEGHVSMMQLYMNGNDPRDSQYWIVDDHETDGNSYRTKITKYSSFDAYKKGEDPIYDVMEKDISQTMYGWDSCLDGAADPTNSGTITSQDVTVGTATLSVILVPFTFGYSAVGITAAVATVANGVDDMGSDMNGNSISERYFDSEKGQKWVKGVKTAGYVISFANGVYNLGTVGPNGYNVVSTGLDINSVRDDLSNRMQNQSSNTTSSGAESSGGNNSGASSTEENSGSN